jgi:hypothetical protein
MTEPKDVEVTTEVNQNDEPQAEDEGTAPPPADDAVDTSVDDGADLPDVDEEEDAADEEGDVEEGDEEEEEA